MVRGHDLDRAVRDAPDERFTVGAAPQRRVHLEAPFLLQILVAQQQVVRRRFTAHPQSLCLGAAHQLDTLFRGDMADMVLAAGLLRERDIALHLPPLALRTDAFMPVFAAVDPVVDITAPQQVVDLAVGHDGLADRRGPAHRLLHQFVRLHAAAVVGKSDHLRSQSRKVDQLAAAALSQRDRAVGFHAHHGVAADDRQLFAERRRRIGRRAEVGHRADRSVASPGRRRGTRGDGLLLRETRLAQVHMHVDQPRHEAEPPEVHDPVARPRFPGCDHTAALDGETARFEPAPAVDRRVDIISFHLVRTQKNRATETVTLIKQ